MKHKILNLLKSKKDAFLSGQKISDEIGISRAAVWKYIKALKQEGYEIESVSRRGYRIIASPDLLTQEEIKNYLNTECIGKKIIHFDTINSTNIKAKELADLGEQEGTIVISEEQTLGRGRLGRSWISPKYKGIWMSIILRPNINPIHVSKITQVGAAAVCKAAEEMGIKTQIKWPNDIILNNKKVCGILTEMSAELNKINYVVMGIGINVNIDKNEFPDDIKHMAASFKSEIGKEILRKELAARVLNNFELLYKEFTKEGIAKASIDICRENSILLGKEINVIRDNKTISAKAVNLDGEGELIIQHSNGEIEKLISGEVSIRGLYGYV
jgi:BirA family biotin operon repressor/biotin-[acetyl-CoA-carboxylase] ligase